MKKISGEPSPFVKNVLFKWSKQKISWWETVSYFLIYEIYKTNSWRIYTIYYSRYPIINNLFESCSITNDSTNRNDPVESEVSEIEITFHETSLCFVVSSCRRDVKVMLILNRYKKL